MAKITYDDKVKIKDIPVAEINKFTAANATEVKTVVNGLDDNINAISNQLGVDDFVDATWQWIPGTYSYFVTVKKFRLNGILYLTPFSETITADAADATFDRTDAIVVNENETITKITGTPSAIPSPPDLIDFETQLLITHFDVTAATTAPPQAEQIQVFDEDLQEVGGEWNMVYTSGSVSTEQASSGTKSIKLINKQSAFANSTVKYIGSNL